MGLMGPMGPMIRPIRPSAMSATLAVHSRLWIADFDNAGFRGG